MDVEEAEEDLLGLLPDEAAFFRFLFLEVTLVDIEEDEEDLLGLLPDEAAAIAREAADRIARDVLMRLLLLILGGQKDAAKEYDAIKRSTKRQIFGTGFIYSPGRLTRLQSGGLVLALGLHSYFLVGRARREMLNARGRETREIGDWPRGLRAAAALEVGLTAPVSPAHHLDLLAVGAAAVIPVPVRWLSTKREDCLKPHRERAGYWRTDPLTLPVSPHIVSFYSCTRY